MPLARQAQAAPLLGVTGRSQRSAEAAQAPGKPDLVRVVEHAALPVLLAASLVRDPVWLCLATPRGSDRGHLTELDVD